MYSKHCGEPRTIIQGQKPRGLIVRLVDPVTGDPFVLTGAVEILCAFLNLDGTETVLTFTGAGGITVLDYSIGKIMISPTAAQTALMQTVQLATLQVSVTFGGDPAACQIKNAYSVVSPQPNP